MNNDNGNPAVVLFTWNAGIFWGKMRCCLDMAIEDAKKKLKIFADGNFKEIKVAIKITGKTTKTDFREKFLIFHDDFVNGKYPNLRAIVVFADIPNACLVNSCKDEMDDFLSKNIPIISSICGQQSLLKKGYFNCWCPSIETVARYAAYIIGSEFTVRAPKGRPKIWCFYTDNDFGKKSRTIFTNWLLRTLKISPKLVCLRLANKKCLSRGRPDNNDLVFITGFGKDYADCTSEVAGAVKDSVYLLFDQSIADPENYLGDSEYKLNRYAARHVRYIDFVLPFNGSQRFNELTDKFKVLPFVTFRLVDQILSSTDAFKELNTLPLIEVDGVSYLMTKRHERIYAATSLLEGKIDREQGRLIEKTMPSRDASSVAALTQERIGLLLQAVDDQLKNVSLKVSEDKLLQVANEIENVFRLSLRDCDFALRLPVSIDGSKEYVSGDKCLQAVARSMTKIHDLGIYKNIIKISLIKQDFAEDNDIAGLYIKTDGSDFPVPLKYWDKKETVESVVLSRDIENDEHDGSYDFQYVPDKKSRKSCNDLLLEVLNCSIDNRWHFLYFIPYEMSSDSMGILLIATKSKFSYLDGRVLTAVASQMFSSVASGLKSKGILFASTKSAIGSIMSRNGSHNIGSHVLAALSHNVGTMPDDRVLYQYIQQRMDYIANVTTEAPSWSQPTMFLGDIMRTFLSQRHLLSHIAESEGLGAWEFQNKNMDDLMARGQHDKLRFQIRRHFKNEKNCGVNYTSVIGYENNGATIDFQDDIAIAIPGGIAGQHAFFTIIENIVRNAAKHDWSNPPKKTEAFKKKDKGQDDDGRYGNLNIYIDYEDKELDGCVEFTIWTNMSDVLEHVDDGKGLDSAKAIHNILNKKLDAQFIDEKTGGLRRENWGLAEMRISAGYLQGNNISEIGGIDKPAKPIIQATVHNEDGINHLAYRFCVPKPKRMLILVDDDRSNRTECEKARLQEVLKKYRNQASECKKFGLYVKTYTEVKAECSDKKKPKLNYEYVVMDDMREEQASWYLPFRVLSIKQTEVAGAKDLVPTIGGYASCLDIIEDVTESKGRKSSIESNIKLVEEAIYSSWCSYIKSLQIEKNTVLNLILSVKDDSSGNEGRGLISKRDVVKFVFEESFNSAVRSYIKLNKLSEVSEAYVALNALKEKRRGLVELDKMEGNDYKGLIMRCFQSFCTPTNSVTREESRITKEIAKVKSDKKIKEKFRTKRLAELRKELDEARNKTQEEVGRGIGVYGGFLDYLEKVCEQMETILCKYAENIVTLPSGFRSDGVGVVEESGKVWDAAAVGWWKGPRPSDDALGSVGLDIKAPTIEFIRHYHPEDKDDQPGNRLYAEPLSGSQSYLNMLEKCSFADKATIVKLVETALLRVLVIDERVAKFLREHKDEVSQTYKSMRIYVADDKKVDEELQMLQSKSDKAGIRKLKAFRWCKPQLDSLLVSLSSYNIYEGRKVLQAEAARPVDRKLQNKFTKDGKKQFDVLIVHQGIIDKWFPATANSPETVENLLCYLRQIFPYVIITTGRGSPANIPETARMLPFSTVEATLFRKYPEKLLLMDSVMNILPKGESSYE